MKTDWEQELAKIYSSRMNKEEKKIAIWLTVRSALDQQREEIHTDMLKTCENWHGTGVAMINDYFTKIKDK